MHDPPGPEDPAVAASPVVATEPAGRTRRWVLGALAAVLAGGGAGVATEYARHKPRRKPVGRRPPPALTASVAAEQRLIADLDATTGGSPAVRQVIVQARADHAEHLRVLTALLAPYGAVRPARKAPRSTGAGAAPGTGSPVGVARSRAQLRAAETRASTFAAARATQLQGATAALLASIAACEATHAELLR